MPWISAGASVLGGLFGSSSASNAANAQTAATNKANDLQKYIYDNNVRLNQPVIDAGNTSRNKLMELLGLGGGGGQAPQSTQTYAQLRQSLAPQFTKTGQIMSPVMGEGNVPTGAWEYKDGAPTIDESGLNSAIQQQLSQQSSQTPQTPSADFGSLSRNFTGSDLQNEPGYQFGMNQGLMALDRKNAAGGGYFSGQALKAAQGFAQDYAGTKFNDAFNRDNTNKTRTYNQLSNLAGAGQLGVNNVGSLGGQYANQVGSNLTGLGNAQGAASIASGNAWGGALNGAANNFQQYNMMNKLMSQPSPWSGTGYGGYNNDSSYGLG